MADDLLKTYRAKRDFSRTREPAGGDAAGKSPAGKSSSGKSASRKSSFKSKTASGAAGRRYLIQKHAATRLHFDFRLEHEGVLKSWAVTRGPSFDPHDKRLAVRTEDHPLEYGEFEGTIPKGEYGGGTVMLWDEGTWEPLEDPDEGMREGKLKFLLHGERLSGKWTLIRIRNNRDRKSKAENWLLIKEHDALAGPEEKPLIERVTTSVRTGRSMDEIAEGHVEWGRSGAQVKEAAADEARPRDERTQDASPRPRFVPPQLATLVDAPPSGREWLHEIKYDGYRAVAAVGGGQATIYTRTGLDWTERFAPLARPFADLPCRSALLDGEIVVAGAEGRTDFGALQDALTKGGRGIACYLFDLLSLDGEDLRKRPLVERKRLLAALLADQPKAGPLLYSDHVEGHGDKVFAHACELELEGIVSKRADAAYRSDRARSWLKVKCGQGQEFVIIGWADSTVKGRAFSSILLAAREGDRLTYRGRVGSGFGAAELDRVWPELKKREIRKPAAEDVPTTGRKGVHFVRPELVAEIAFRGWSSDGLVRQGSFKGLRTDKRAEDIVREIPAETAKTAAAAAKETKEGAPASRAAEPDAKRVSDPKEAKQPRRGTTAVSDDRDGAIEIEGVRVTNPDRVLFPGQEVTKKALIEYYLAVADRILAHVADRPLSLVRCPRGAGGDCFFQKHASAGFPEAFRQITIKEKSGSDQYLAIDDRKGLVSAVQMGVLELHIWGSHVPTLEQPDRLVFDLDPDEGLAFGAVTEAALDLRERLKALGLVTFAMASGGKGLHVIAPLTPRHDWEDVRAFAEAFARTVADDMPERYLAVMSKARRKGKIFIDYLRNGRGATAIAPFSTRARAGATLAWPVAWSTLKRLPNAHPAGVATALGLLAKQRSDPWAGYFDVDQVLPFDRLGGERRD